jgi:hypothetical protein
VNRSTVTTGPNTSSRTIVISGENRRAHVEAVLQFGCGRPDAAGDEPRTLGLARFDVPLHTLAVVGGDQGARLGGLVRSAAEPDAVGPASKLVDEPVVDAVLDDEPATRRADLAGVQERRRKRVVNDRLEVGVGEDDVRALAAEFEGDPLHVDRGRRHDRLAAGEAARERHEVNVRALRERLADPVARPEHEVDDALRDAGLVEQLHQVDRCQRRRLRRLDDHRVAGRQRGGDLPRDLQQRVVPRGDQTAHPERLVNDPAERIGIGRRDEPAGLLVGEPGVVAKDADHVVDVVLALAEGLARVERLEPGDLGTVALEQLGRTGQERGTFARWAPRPVGLVEGPACGGDGAMNIGVVGNVDLGDDGRVGRVDDLAAGPGR